MDAPEIRLRESPRVELEGAARLFLGAAGAPVVARLIDLSTTGMGLAGPAGLAPGQTSAFELAVDGVTIEGRGVVVWSRRPRQDRGDAPNVGLRFTDLEASSAATIGSWVDRRSAETGRPVGRAAGAAAPAPSAEGERIAPAVVETTELAEEAAVVGGEVAAVEPVPARRSPPRLLPWLALVAGLAIVVGLIAGGGDDEESRTPPAAGSEPSVARTEPVAAPPSAEEAAPPVTVVTEPPVPPPAVAAVESEPPAEQGSATGDLPPPPAVDQLPPGARRILSIEPGRGDGDEVLALRADGPFRREDVVVALIGVDPPRYLLRLAGIERPLEPATLDVGAPLIQRVRTGLHDTPKGQELHVVLDLASRAVEHAWEIDGDVLRVRLRPRAP